MIPPFLIRFNIESAFRVPTLNHKIFLIKLCEIINILKESRHDRVKIYVYFLYTYFINKLNKKLINN